MFHPLNAVKMSLVLMALSSTSAHAQTTFSDIVGRTLSNERGSVVINADGTLVGQFGNAELNATWDVEDGLFCRQGTIGSQALERACQTITIRNGLVSFVNEDGSSQTPYTIQ